MLSRVADNLYWMSRYLERAEHTARLLDVTFNIMLEPAQGKEERRWHRLLESLYVPVPAALDPFLITEAITFDTDRPSSIVSCITSARHNAMHVREQISSEMWEELNSLYHQVTRTTIRDIWEAEPYEFFRKVKEGVHLFQGITDSTMSHGEGWQFIQAGRFLERAEMTSHLVDVHFSEFVPSQDPVMETGEFLEWVGLLKSCSGFEAYCKVYTADIRADRVAEFLLLDPEFPRSVRYAAQQVHHAILAIAEFTDTRRASRVVNVAARLRAALSFTPIEEVISDGGIHAFVEEILGGAADIHKAVYEKFIEYSVDAPPLKV
ncbi:MAG: alpha-E domain-containing protein [Candidatus Xenobia bacterium]